MVREECWELLSRVDSIPLHGDMQGKSKAASNDIFVVIVAQLQFLPLPVWIKLGFTQKSLSVPSQKRPHTQPCWYASWRPAWLYWMSGSFCSLGRLESQNNRSCWHVWFLPSWRNLPTLTLTSGGKSICVGWITKSLEWWISSDESTRTRMER